MEEIHKHIKDEKNINKSYKHAFCVSPTSDGLNGCDISSRLNIMFYHCYEMPGGFIYFY